MPRPDKVEQVKQLSEVFKNAQSFYLADYKGLNVSEIETLRSKFRENNVKYFVAKNTLTKLALEDIGITDLKPFLQGPTAIAVSDEDDIVPGKIIAEFDKKRELPKLKACVVNGKVFNYEETIQVVKLPSRDGLLSMLLNLLKSPMNGLVWGLNGVLQNFVGVLEAVKNQKEEDSK